MIFRFLELIISFLPCPYAVEGWNVKFPEKISIGHGESAFVNQCLNLWLWEERHRVVLRIHNYLFLIFSEKVLKYILHIACI